MPKMPRQKLTQAQLGKMSNKQLARKGYIRVAGFTRKDGTKVKSHIRKLRPSERTDPVDRLMQAGKDLAGLLFELSPGADVRDVSLGAMELSKGNISEGLWLVGLGTVGAVPVVGDAAKVGLKSVRGSSKTAGDAPIINKILSQDEFVKLQSRVNTGRRQTPGLEAYVKGLKGQKKKDYQHAMHQEAKKIFKKKHGFEPNDKGLDLHHIKSVDSGGTNKLSNLAAIRPEDHRAIHINKATKADLGAASLIGARIGFKPVTIGGEVYTTSARVAARVNELAGKKIKGKERDALFEQLRRGDVPKLIGDAIKKEKRLKKAKAAAESLQKKRAAISNAPKLSAADKKIVASHKKVIKEALATGNSKRAEMFQRAIDKINKYAKQ